MPFLAETVYQDLRAKNDPESVHLCDFPVANEKMINQKLESQMEEVRKIVGDALALRAEIGVKVRQPLASLGIKSQIANLKPEKELINLIKEEVNVKEVLFNSQQKQEIKLDVKITDELQQEGNLREIIRAIQALRKQANLTPQDGAIIYYQGDKDLEKLIAKNKKEILKSTKSTKLEAGKPVENSSSIQAGKEIKVDTKDLKLSILK